MIFLNIQMNSFDTKRISNDVLNKVSELRSKVKQLESILDTLSVAWQSEAATSYITGMQEKTVFELNNLCDILQDYGNYLNRVPGAYERLDEVFLERRFDFK